MLDSKIGRVSDICGGKIDAEFRDMLEKIIQNMKDPNYDKNATRKMTFVVTLKPDPTSNMIGLTLDADLSLPKKGSRKSFAYIGKGQNGQIGLFTDDPDQTNLFKQLADGQKKEAK